MQAAFVREIRDLHTQVIYAREKYDVLEQHYIALLENFNITNVGVAQNNKVCM